jgi:hypothetical protein
MKQSKPKVGENRYNLQEVVGLTTFMGMRTIFSSQNPHFFCRYIGFYRQKWLILPLSEI